MNVILDSNTLSVIDWYFQDSPIVPVTSGITLEVPAGLTWDLVKGVKDDEGTISLVEDPVKLAAKAEAQKAQNKAQRNSLLQQSDWSTLTDVFLANKDEWISYRSMLRAIDPSNPVWPQKPQVVWSGDQV